MRTMLIAASLALITARVAVAEAPGLLGGDAVALHTNPTVAPVVTSDASVTNPGQPGAAINETDSFGLGATIPESLHLSMKPGLSDNMSLDGSIGGLFADPDTIRLAGEALFLH